MPFSVAYLPTLARSSAVKIFVYLCCLLADSFSLTSSSISCTVVLAEVTAVSVCPVSSAVRRPTLDLIYFNRLILASAKQQLVCVGGVALYINCCLLFYSCANVVSFTVYICVSSVVCLSSPPQIQVIHSHERWFVSMLEQMKETRAFIGHSYITILKPLIVCTI